MHEKKILDFVSFASLPAVLFFVFFCFWSIVVHDKITSFADF